MRQDQPPEGAPLPDERGTHPTNATATPDQPETGEETWHLSVAYDGTRFRGYQIQPDQPTVQYELQHRLRLLFRNAELRIAGTSRTDAGVHALDQNVSFKAVTPDDLDPETVRRTLNRWLPADIKVKTVELGPQEFHARHSARGKAYTYALHRGEKCDPLFARFVWALPAHLDVSSMQEAAAHLCGEHDFASFAVNARREISSTIRVLNRLEITANGEMVYFSVLGDSFLYKMVRSVVGYLVHVGKGSASAHETPAVLEARDRCAAAESAPAQGLFLAQVFFAPDAWKSYTPVLPPFAWQHT